MTWIIPYSEEIFCLIVQNIVKVRALGDSSLVPQSMIIASAVGCDLKSSQPPLELRGPKSLPTAT